MTGLPCASHCDGPPLPTLSPTTQRLPNALPSALPAPCGRPYGDDGSEHSARIAKLGEQKYWEAEGVRSAVKVLKGKLNDKGGAEWTV